MSREANSFTLSAGADVPASEFPTFKGADVHIIVSGARQYHLHSAQLKTISPVLAEMLSDDRAAKLNKSAIKKGVTVKYRLVLLQNTKKRANNCPAHPDPEPMRYVLCPVELDENGKPSLASPIGLDLENGRVVEPMFLAYDSVFAAFYGVAINFGRYHDNIQEILETAMNIIKVAEYLQCIHIVTRPLEAALLGTGQVLFKSISRNPVVWLEYAIRVRSRTLFREALIHTVGQFNMTVVKDKLDTLPSSVNALVRSKVARLQDALKDAQMRILSYYPAWMQKEKTVGRVDKDNIGKANYASDVVGWISLTIIRHFFCQNLAADETHHAADMGKEVFDIVLIGGDAYLNKTDLDVFFNHFPMSGKLAAVVESHLTDMKEYIKSFVQPFAKNESQLDVHNFPIKHFTCVPVAHREYPWENETIGQVDVGGSEDDDEEGMQLDEAEEKSSEPDE